MGNYFTEEESRMIIRSIADVEKSTIGELRLHVEDYCENDPFERAQYIFYQLQMQHTENHSGVLIYIAAEDKKLAIIGDEGIHHLVGQDYWDQTLTAMADHIVRHGLASATVWCIEHMGRRLAEFFPEKGQERNELSNEISYGNI